MSTLDPRLERTLFEFDFPSFADRARCAEVDGEMWFPDTGRSAREARKVCATCEVIEECLAYALAHDERHGVWGGLTYRERRKLAGKTTNPAPKICAIDECDLPVRPTTNGRGWTKFCTIEHAALGNARRTAARSAVA